MEKLTELLRAKSEKEDTGEQDDPNLTLKGHISETLKRLNQLNQYIEKNKEWLTYEQYKNDSKRKQLFKSLAKTLILHDLGKIEYGFQRKVHTVGRETGWEDFKDKFSGMPWIKSTEGIRHELYSMIWSIALLQKEGKEEGKIRTAVLLHHYNDFYVNRQKQLWEILDFNSEKMKAYMEFLIKNRDALEQFLKDVFQELNRETNFGGFIKEAVDELRTQMNFEEIINLKKQVENEDDDVYAEFYIPEEHELKENLDFLVMLGILRRCDYSGSGNIDIESCQDISEFYSSLAGNIKEKIEKNGRYWQAEVLPNEVENNLLIAPTGSGKTEFSVLWAQQQPRKLLYTLPLRVALNDMYNKRFQKTYELGTDDISLLHSSSFLEFEGNDGISMERKISSARQFAAPLMLTTPDQVFLSSLNYYGSDKLYSIYPLSTIVIDEIQAYDPEMAAIIFQTLDNIKCLGGRILVMTATHPPYFDEFLKDFEKIDIETKKEQIKNYERKRHKIQFVESSLVTPSENDTDKDEPSSQELKDNIAELKAANRNILLITNTVKRAVSLYKHFKDEFQDEPELVQLLHSRLIEREKGRRINKIKNQLCSFRKGQTKKPMLLISTQMVEASVDVDFDALITEISPIDSQIQRWGRVHRNREENYEGEPNIIVFGRTDGEENKMTKVIYDSDVVEKTAQVLQKYNGKLLDFEEEKRLFSEVFRMQTTEGITVEEKYVNMIRELKKNLKYFSVEKRSESQRLFRNIAGSSFVFPDLMKDYGVWGEESNKEEREWYEKVAPVFAEIISNYERRDASWKDIVSRLQTKLDVMMNDKKLVVFRLRKLLYEFSINLPLYFTEGKKGEGWSLTSHEFKGFYVFKDLRKEDMETVTEQGIDGKERIENYLHQSNFI